MAMKYIKRVSKVKNDDTKGYIINSTNVVDKEKNTYSANVIDGLISEKTDKAYFSWYEFKALSIPANSQANLIDAQQIKTTGKPIFISISVTAMVASGNWSLYLYVDGVARQRLLSADNHGTPLNYTNSTIITYIDEGTHTFEFRISCDGVCTVPNYNQHSIVVCEI